MSLALLFAFPFLVAQYESWTLPISIILSLAFAALGAILSLAVVGLENSLYAQIGIVLLIGLALKNAILIVEAAVAAASQRFRAVRMTAISFILAMIPLVLANGAGAGASVVLGRPFSAACWRQPRSASCSFRGCMSSSNACSNGQPASEQDGRSSAGARFPAICSQSYPVSNFMPSNAPNVADRHLTVNETI